VEAYKYHSWSDTPVPKILTRWHNEAVSSHTPKDKGTYDGMLLTDSTECLYIVLLMLCFSRINLWWTMLWLSSHTSSSVVRTASSISLHVWTARW
jgi:hypothetical protein